MNAALYCDLRVFYSSSCVALPTIQIRQTRRHALAALRCVKMTSFLSSMPAATVSCVRSFSGTKLCRRAAVYLLTQHVSNTRSDGVSCSTAACGARALAEQHVPQYSQWSFSHEIQWVTPRIKTFEWRLNAAGKRCRDRTTGLEVGPTESQCSLRLYAAASFKGYDLQVIKRITQWGSQQSLGNITLQPWWNFSIVQH